MERNEPTPIVRAIRKAGGQALLGAEIGCTQQAISAAKRAGKPSPAMAVRIALYLGERPELLWPDLFAIHPGRDAA